MNFDFDLVTRSFPLLLLGAGVTIQITALSVGFGLVIGVFMGMARLSKMWVIRSFAAVYVDFIRGTPLLVQIFLIYFTTKLIFNIINIVYNFIRNLFLSLFRFFRG